ncbi:hypothetical protein HPB50_010717 [Hyalomma asiaticum]|uniref:Uncharacterized protein n=1 Tax=Hyalomma asiaticum TaxID=266040 RepID=A0ACB7SKZ2_HYAAI|nr:hypothetical protein HPB50_010717 [Hyalomma asiaticum]
MSKPVKRQTHCFAPGCSTGYVSARKASVKKSVFAVPSSEDRLKEWRRAVPRADKILDQTSVLCESHFEERFILRDYTHIVNGEVVKIPRGRPCLTEDAIPTIFPNTPSYLSKKLPQKRHSRTSRGEVLGKKRKTNDENEPPMEHDSALDATADGAPVIGACTVERLDYLQGEMLPNKYWCRCLLVDAPKAVAFTVCSQAGDSLSFQKLVLCSAEDTRYHCSVFVQGVTVKKVEVFDAESVKSLLHSVNEMIVCSGFEQSAVPLEQHAWEEEVGKLGFLSQATAEGLRVTLASTVSILEYVTGKLGYQYLLTSRLSQDPLENVFGILRQMSGSNDHPTPTQFLLSANCLSFCSLAKAPANGNVSPAMLQSLIRGCNKDRREVEKKLDELMDVGCLSEVHEILTSSGIQMDHGAMVSAKSDSRDGGSSTLLAMCRMEWQPPPTDQTSGRVAQVTNVYFAVLVLPYLAFDLNRPNPVPRVTFDVLEV